MGITSGTIELVNLGIYSGGTATIQSVSGGTIRLNTAFTSGASVLALLISIWPSLQPISGTISHWWLVLIVMALFGAGIFKTDPITENSPNWVNTIHAVCGMRVLAGMTHSLAKYTCD